MTRDEIKKELYKGDGIRIVARLKAKGVTTKVDYVYHVLRGVRKSNKKTGKAIMEEAELVAIDNMKEKKPISQNN